VTRSLARLGARVAAFALLTLLGATAAAKTREECEREYTPQRAQDGKDVIWVPTEDSMVERMLAMANVSATDIVYDLGAGDGKIPIAAAKRFGAKAVGIEYDAPLARHAECLVEAEGVGDLVDIVQGDIFETDFSEATVVTLYLLPELNLRLRPTLLEMPPGTRVVSYSFTMREWQADEFIHSDDGSGSAYLWIVPARVDGAWSFRPPSGGDALDVTFEQTFQNLGGSVAGGPLRGSLRGSRIRFSWTDGGGASGEFEGAVDGGVIRGVLTRDSGSSEYVGARR
jgi:hypothetical protein